MSESIDRRIRRFVSLYDRGMITEIELCGKIASSAVDPEFFDYLDIIPPDVMPQLRKIAESAPAHPEDCFIIESICAGPNFDYETHDRERRETAYWSARRLREYFFPDLPLPEFEPFKLAGVVDDVVVVDDAIVIFGDIRSHLIRKNPIHLIAPTGRKTITSATGIGFTKRDRAPESTDSIIKRHGRYGIRLGHAVKSTSDTPPGTKVWVDRTAVGELPDPPCT